MRRWVLDRQEREIREAAAAMSPLPACGARARVRGSHKGKPIHEKRHIMPMRDEQPWRTNRSRPISAEAKLWQHLHSRQLGGYRFNNTLDAPLASIEAPR